MKSRVELKRHPDLEGIKVGTRIHIEAPCQYWQDGGGDWNRDPTPVDGYFRVCAVGENYIEFMPWDDGLH